MNSTDTRTPHPVLSFLAIVLFFQAMGGLMGWITTQGVDGWYQTLAKSPLNPPDAAFGIVWTLLYLALSISFWLVWKSPKTPERRFVLVLFISHMALNWLWSPLFFSAHMVFASLIVIFAMIFTGAMLAWLVFQIDRRAALVFAPYIGWLCFAGHLTHFILMKN